MSDKVKIGLIGTGRIGQVHAASIAALPETTLRWVCDPFVESAEATAQKHEGAQVTADPTEVLDSGEVDAIIVASPTPTHVDLISAAIDAGIPVLCEKPIDLDIARVDALRQKARAATVPVVLGFNRRFDPHFAELQRRVARGDIGPLEHLTITSRDPEPAPAAYLRDSGGIFRDMTIHDFDMSRFFVPDIVEVTARGAQQFSDDIAALGDYDAVVVTLRGARGELITIINSRHSAYGYDQRIEAFGAAGLLQVGNIGPTIGARLRRRIGRRHRPVPHVLPSAIRRGVSPRTCRLRRGHPWPAQHQPRLRRRTGRTDPCRRRRPFGSRGHFGRRRPERMSTPALVATCWTSAGNVAPLDDPEVSPFSAIDRVRAVAFDRLGGYRVRAGRSAGRSGDGRLPRPTGRDRGRRAATRRSRTRFGLVAGGPGLARNLGAAARGGAGTSCFVHQSRNRIRIAGRRHHTVRRTAPPDRRRSGGGRNPRGDRTAPVRFDRLDTPRRRPDPSGRPPVRRIGGRLLARLPRRYNAAGTREVSRPRHGLRGRTQRRPAASRRDAVRRHP